VRDQSPIPVRLLLAGRILRGGCPPGHRRRQGFGFCRYPLRRTDGHPGTRLSSILRLRNIHSTHVTSERPEDRKPQSSCSFVPGDALLPEDSATPWFPRGRGIRASGRLCPAHGQSQSDVEVDSKALPRSSMPSEPWRWRTPSFRIYAPPGCHGQGGRRNAATSRLKARVRSVPTAISSVWRFGKHWQGKAHVKPGPEQKPQTRAGCSGCGWGAPQVNAAVNGVAANGSDLVGAEF